MCRGSEISIQFQEDIWIISIEWVFLIGHSGTAFVVQYLKILAADTDKRKQENALIQEQASSFLLTFHITKCLNV